MSSLNSRKIKAFVRKYRIQPNSLIVVDKSRFGEDDETLTSFVRNLERVILETGIANVVIVVVNDAESIAAVDEKFMARHGWFNANSMKRLFVPHNTGGAAGTDREGDHE